MPPQWPMRRAWFQDVDDFLHPRQVLRTLQRLPVLDEQNHFDHHRPRSCTSLALNTMSFLVFHNVHIAPAHTTRSNLFEQNFLPFSTLSKISWAITGAACQLKVSFRKDQRKFSIGHWKIMWSVVSVLPHILQFMSPLHFFSFLTVLLIEFDHGKPST